MNASTVAQHPQINLSVLGDQPYPSYELRNIIRYLDQEGKQESDDLMAHIQIRRAELGDHFVPAHKVLSAFQYCSKLYGPISGALAGKSYRVNDLGVFGYAFASTANLQHALMLADKYNSLLGNVFKRAELVVGDHLECKLFNVQGLDDDCISFFAALSMSARLHVARSIFGDDLNYSKVHFDFNDEPNRHIYEALFGCPVVFNADFNAWEIDLKELQRERKEGNHSDCTQYLSYCNELLEQIKQKDSLVNEIQQILVSCAGDYPDIEMLASAFKVSSRTLRRQLANLGTSYQKILNKVRCQLSIEYLTRTEITIEDISNLIGFSDVTNFRHAFKKWVGKTPSHYRKTYQLV